MNGLLLQREVRLLRGDDGSVAISKCFHALG